MSSTSSTSSTANDTETGTCRICPLCKTSCGLDVRTQDGKVTQIGGAGNGVFSHGCICPEGVA